MRTSICYFLGTVSFGLLTLLLKYIGITSDVSLAILVLCGASVASFSAAEYMSWRVRYEGMEVLVENLIEIMKNNDLMGGKDE